MQNISKMLSFIEWVARGGAHLLTIAYNFFVRGFVPPTDYS